MRTAHVLGIATLAIVAIAPSRARADFDFQLSAGMNARWIRKTPTLEAPAMTTFARELPPGDVPMRGGMTMLGGYVDIALTIDDRWVVPMLGGGYYGATGSYDAIITTRDGSIVRAQPWTASSFDIYLPGLGYRMKQRRWMFGAALRTGASIFWMDGLMASGAGYDAMEMKRASFLLQGELEACRRLDPVTRVCLQVAPRIYDHDLLSGVMFGLRAEWGR